MIEYVSCKVNCYVCGATWVQNIPRKGGEIINCYNCENRMESPVIKTKEKKEEYYEK